MRSHENTDNINMYHLYSSNDDLEMQLKALQRLQSWPCSEIDFVFVSVVHRFSRTVRQVVNKQTV